MTDLLDKHSEDYDPDTFTALVDDQRKAEKEGRIGEHLAEARAVEAHQEAKHGALVPPRRELADVFTGELLDRDDLPALTAALERIDAADSGEAG